MTNSIIIIITKYN